VTSPAPLRVLFFADAGPEVGGGHVMRCLTLARALATRGADCAFVESRAAAPILRRFGWPAQTLLAILGEQDLADLISYAEDFAERFAADVVVIDHYGVAVAEEERLGVGGRRIVVIDDLADRRHACDLLVDPGFGRRREHYDGLTPPEAVVCVGPVHALVRPEFAAARQRAMSRRARHAPVGRALVSLGLTDVGAVTARVVEALAPTMGEIRLDVVLGGEAPSLQALEAAASRDRRLRLWIDSAEMASLMADADIAIGAGGSSVWEQATVGLPAATAVLADNQRGMIEQMAGAGLTLPLDPEAADFESRLREAWGALVADTELRWRLTERTADLCDGHGAQRVADAVMGLRG
jgi:UDP-2,4-diacetamido-2,4,6-trideoxy-beta-L-altropyranose hydrolase